MPGDEYDAAFDAEFLAEVAGIAAIPGGADVGRAVCGAGFFGQDGMKGRTVGTFVGTFELERCGEVWGLLWGLEKSVKLA